jgi:hypothetical protein
MNAIIATTAWKKYNKRAYTGKEHNQEEASISFHQTPGI